MNNEVKEESIHPDLGVFEDNISDENYYVNSDDLCDTNFEDLKIKESDISKELEDRKIKDIEIKIVSLSKHIANKLILSREKRICIESVPIYGISDKPFSFGYNYKIKKNKKYDLYISFIPLDKIMINKGMKKEIVQILDISTKMNLSDSLAEGLASIICKMNGQERIAITSI